MDKKLRQKKKKVWKKILFLHFFVQVNNTDLTKRFFFFNVNR